MEVEAVLFIGAAIIAVTEAIKHLVPTVNGAVTIGVSVLVGVLVALLDTEIGVQNLTVAQGIMTALASSGVVTVAKKV